MSTQWGMWISGIMRLVFLVYLITAAWQDFKYRSIRFYVFAGFGLSLIHISEPTRQEAISYAVFCL